MNNDNDNENDYDSGKGNGISNHYINSILKPTCPNFLGVYSSDNIPLQLLQLQHDDTFFIVCNLSRVRESGSHFITIMCFPQYVLYIDSFGLPCTVKEIQSFLSKLKKQIFYNVQRVQAASSSFCGFFCILFVLHFNSLLFATTPAPIMFDKENLSANDAICIQKICEILNKDVY